MGGPSLRYDKTAEEKIQKLLTGRNVATQTLNEVCSVARQLLEGLVELLRNRLVSLFLVHKFIKETAVNGWT
jgi:hypothetical protein